MPSTAEPELASSLDGVPLFRSLPAAARRELSARAERTQVAAGEHLFRQGDVGDSMYVVLTGRLKVYVETPEPLDLRILGRGAAIGELSLLTGSSRSASIRALRDSELLRLDKDDFTSLLREQSEFSIALASVLAKQLQESRGVAIATPPVAGTISIVALRPGLPVGDLADRLVAQLGRWRTVARLDLGDATNGRGESDAARLDRLERAAEQVVLVGGELRPDDDWSMFCLRQGDRVLALTGPGAPPPWLGDVAALRGCDLVLYDGVDVRSWYAPLEPRTTHRLHAEPRFAASADRIARRLAGRSVGVVLSGGGARALSSLGALDAILAAGIPIDRIAGCSLGAFISAQFAAGRDPDQITASCRYEFIEHYPWNDYTIPLAAPIRGHKLREMFERVFGDGYIEELELPFFCVSSDLVEAELVVHDHGPLGPAVSASMCLPGAAPPVPMGDRMLVDGAIFDNLPVGTMAAKEDGDIIAVDVTAQFMPPRKTDGPSRRQSELVQRLQTFVVGDEIPRPRYRHTMIRSMLLGSADTTEEAKRHARVAISPEISHIGLTGFKHLDEARALGRKAAEEALAAASDFVASARSED